MADHYSNNTAVVTMHFIGSLNVMCIMIGHTHVSAHLNNSKHHHMLRICYDSVQCTLHKYIFIGLHYVVIFRVEGDITISPYHNITRKIIGIKSLLYQKPTLLSLS